MKCELIPFVTSKAAKTERQQKPWKFSGIQLHDWKIPLFFTLGFDVTAKFEAKWDGGTRRIRPRQSDRTLMPSVICCFALTGGKIENIPTRISEKSFISPFVLVPKVQSHPVCFLDVHADQMELFNSSSAANKRPSPCTTDPLSGCCDLAEEIGELASGASMCRASRTR